MSDAIHWVLEVAIEDGQLDAFKALMTEMVAATQANEPGATHYEWYISDDEKTCHIYERYIDSAATMTHLGSFGQNFAERFLAAVAPSRLVVYGDPDAAVRDALAGFGALHMTQIGGFAR